MGGMMNWTPLVLGIVLGSCVTTVLVWFQNQSLRVQAEGYFSRLALSVVLTSVFAAAALSVISVLTTGHFDASGMVFGGGWMLGGLLAAWFVSGPMRRT